MYDRDAAREQYVLRSAKARQIYSCQKMGGKKKKNNIPGRNLCLCAGSIQNTEPSFGSTETVFFFNPRKLSSILPASRHDDKVSPHSTSPCTSEPLSKQNQCANLVFMCFCGVEDIPSLPSTLPKHSVTQPRWMSSGRSHCGGWRSCWYWCFQQHLSTSWGSAAGAPGGARLSPPISGCSMSKFRRQKHSCWLGWQLCQPGECRNLAQRASSRSPRLPIAAEHHQLNTPATSPRKSVMLQWKMLQQGSS